MLSEMNMVPLLSTKIAVGLYNSERPEPHVVEKPATVVPTLEPK